MLCRLRVKGKNRDLGWWQFAVTPEVGQPIRIGLDLPEYFQVAIIMHNPVIREEVSDTRPPYVELIVEPFEWASLQGI